MLIKCCLTYTIILNLFIYFTFSLKLKNSFKSKGDEDDLYGEDLDAAIAAYNKSGKLYNTKQTEYFSEYYEKPNLDQIASHVGNLMKGGIDSKRSFHKLNAIANNYVKGQNILKSDAVLTKNLKLMLTDNKMNPIERVKAGKLASRLNDMPITFQITSDNTNRKPTNLDSYIIVPRIKRIYRPDYYVENYKAGNWDA